MKRMLLAIIVSFATMAAHGEYTLKITRGKYPEDVRIENLNGNIPLSAWYKQGWTEDGWTSGDYGTSYSVALSPSRVSDGSIFENALTLPTLTIEEGEWLSWDGCEVYPLFSDTYTVEIKPKGSEQWSTLGEYTESKSSWNRHLIDLSQYHGKEAAVRFVCRSENGYMLALHNIAIKKPSEHTFTAISHTPKFFAIGELDDGKAPVDITVMNTGLPISNALICISTDDSTVYTLRDEDAWATGETRNYQLDLPLIPNVKTTYKITIEPKEEEKHTLAESFAYCTSFKRHLFVDKGTGMWCNACPKGTLAIEELEETYGDALIVGETHNGDPLANDMYFSRLKFYSIPHLMLNHIQATKGDDASKFEKQICIPTEMGITLSDLKIKSDGSLSARASVSTSESFTDTEHTYRIGYLLTRNVGGNEEASYYQKNICTMAKDMQYCYLPSMMLYSMCSFPNVTIPNQLATTEEEPAFTGISGSLPESLNAAETYDFELDIPRPEGIDSFDGLRLVAFIINDGNRYIINSTVTSINDSADIEEIKELYGETDRKRIFTIEGSPVKGERNSLLPGLYIINGEKVLIK